MNAQRLIAISELTYCLKSWLPELRRRFCKQLYHYVWLGKWVVPLRPKTSKSSCFHHLENINIKVWIIYMKFVILLFRISRTHADLSLRIYGWIQALWPAHLPQETEAWESLLQRSCSQWAGVQTELQIMFIKIYYSYIWYH